MNIKRIIDKYGRLIGYVILAIVLGLWAIRSLNSYYEKKEEIKAVQAAEDQVSEGAYNTTNTQNISNSTKSKSSYKTINSFVNYCNNKEVEKAYKMLTDECKKAMFPTVEDFQLYINNIYNITRNYELTKWSTDGNKTTYLITLHGDVLATGGKANSVQDYYTLVKDDNGFYKLNINNYIYGQEKNLESTVNNIKIKVGNVDVYEEYEEATITITNGTSKTICLTGNKYRENIYLQNSKGMTYSSLNSEFDGDEIILEPNTVQTYIVEFNKVYSSTNKASYLVLSDVILDYEEYLNSTDKENYSNRTSIKAKY